MKTDAIHTVDDRNLIEKWNVFGINLIESICVPFPNYFFNSMFLGAVLNLSQRM
jgi:hypothetical protein